MYPLNPPLHPAFRYEFVEIVKPKSSSTVASNTKETVPTVDMRAEFERLSRQVPRDPNAEHAFIKSKIDLIRSNPHMSNTDKERAIRELQQR